MKYAIAIEPSDINHSLGVVVPDLPGCFSAGDSLDEAIVNAKEAIELWIEAMQSEGRAIPRPSGISVHINNPDFKGWAFAIVEIDSKLLADNTKRNLN